MDGKTALLRLSKEELSRLLVSHGEKSYRGGQIFRGLSRGIPISEMSDLPLQLREKLSALNEDRMPVIERKLVSAKDGTAKYLFSLIDGECIESVFMRYKHGNTLCVSSQAGCRMGCRFCASTLSGRVRNLSASEILGQVIAASRDTGERVSGIVLMGIGEPLDNYDEVVRFLRLVSDEDGLNIGLRHVSLSTCGLADGIMRLAGEGLPVTLSLSLHACTDEERSELMPVNRKYPLKTVLGACRTYFEKTGRRVSFEYTLIRGKNDDPSSARRLAQLLTREVGRNVHVNLIRLNEVKETGLISVSAAEAETFRKQLETLGINATVRRRLGSDIDASCGQLRITHLREEAAVEKEGKI